MASKFQAFVTWIAILVVAPSAIPTSAIETNWLGFQSGPSSTFAQPPKFNAEFIQQQRIGANDDIGDLKCAKLIADVKMTEGTVSSKLPPDITGLWLSQRCETRPGPSFLLRKYYFSSNRTFELLQFYYSDHLCSKPTHAIRAEGKVQMTSPSWIVPGGMETDYLLTKVAILAYTKQVAAKLGEKFNSSCQFPLTFNFSHHQPWQQRRWYAIYKYNSNENLGDKSIEAAAVNDIEAQQTDEFDCLDTMGIIFHELQLMRTEYRKSRHHRQRWKGRKTELLLGEAVYDATSNHFYRPTSYQTPLLKSDQINICGICRLVNKSSESFPPHLDSQSTYSWSVDSHQHLSGDWISTRCETRPFSMFLTRQITFYHHSNSKNATNLRWKGIYSYFLDARCRKPSFTLTAHGYYHISGLSTVIDGASDIDFNLDSMLITPHTVAMVNTLNDNDDGQCGTSGTWRMEQTQNVTITNGCLNLRLTVPSKEYEIVKLEMDRYGNSWMYLGGLNAFSQSNQSGVVRPTAFQLPLLQCRKRVNDDEEWINLNPDNNLKPMSQMAVANYFIQVNENNASFIKYHNYLIITAIFIYHLICIY
ncbi:hypothetical protein CHUAL_012317 [Chamberlinius hualienensis]